MKKIIYLMLCSMVIASCSQGKKEHPGKYTQAYLGVKEGGEWVWVTKNNGKEQYEYNGGTFKSKSEITVPEKHTDHSSYFQFEGPGWESDKIGYRLYLDWRNAIDIFGKKVDTMVLHQVGQDGFDSYHEIAYWGVDVLNVGSSLGMGSLAFWDGENATRIEKTDSIYCGVSNQKTSSEVTVYYHGWAINDSKTDVKTKLTIEEGSYLTRYNIRLSNELPNLTSGIVKHPGAELVIIEDIKSGWNCMATFGIQTLQEDKLGMCIFYRKDEILELTEDKFSHLVVLKPNKKEISFYFGAVWQQDMSAVNSVEEFKSILMDQARFVK